MAFLKGTRTNANPYLVNVLDPLPNSNVDPEYSIFPILTVGDEVPLLTGTFNQVTFDPTKTFAMTGIPDGLGYHNDPNGFNYIWMNHEIGETTSSSISSTIPGSIKGARVSLFVFDQYGNSLGGKNLIERAIEADGTVYTLDLNTGDYKNANGQILNFIEGIHGGNFGNFSSSYLATTGFVDSLGNPVPVYFAPEENGSAGRGWAITPDGTAQVLAGLGRYSKEQVLSASQYRATNSDKTVFLSTEDTSDGELYMYIGDQTQSDPNGFKDITDSLYVLRVKDAQGNYFNMENMPEDVALTTEWVLVPNNVAVDADGTSLSTWVNGNDNGVIRSTNFQRLKDISEDPNKPGTFYFVTTGVNGTENTNGKLYSLSFNAADPKGNGTLTYLMNGGSTTGVSYDNLVVSLEGNVLIQEDSTANGTNILQQQQRNGRILSYNIAENAGKVGTDDVTFLLELDQKAAGPQFPSGTFGDWESSGIIQIFPDVFGTTVQAHTIIDGKYVQGGQFIAFSPEISNLNFGTANNDTIEVGLTPNIDGNKDKFFMGTGADFVSTEQSLGENRVFSHQDNDTLMGGTGDMLNGGVGDDIIDTSRGGGNNRLYGCMGNDKLYFGKNDAVFGEDGNDEFFAVPTSPGGNRLYGGAGNDTFYLGANDRVFGDAGNDKFYASAGPNGNIITGGFGMDEFWIASGSLPMSMNTINDFNPMEDKLGLGGVGLSFGQLTLTQSGLDTMIKSGTTDIALLKNIQATSLVAGNFVFA